MSLIKSDGSTAEYYELPQDATELQHLISHKNMNAQIGEIFRACYRYGEVAHSEMLRDAKKIMFYAQAEIDRLENISTADIAKQEFNSGIARINITSYEEQPDGSAIVHLDMGPEAQRLLIEEGFLSLVRKYCDDQKNPCESASHQTQLEESDGPEAGPYGEDFTSQYQD
jgi:hypothetical protein